MRVLSLWQPWASLIVHGRKSIETRGYPTNVRGRIAIHATKSAGEFDYTNELQSATFQMVFGFSNHPLETPLLALYRLPRGAIIGTVEVYDCLPVERFKDGRDLSKSERAFGNYEAGRYGWLLRNPILLRHPIPVKGKQGWWNFDLNLCSCGEPVEPGTEFCTECHFSAVNCL